MLSQKNLCICRKERVACYKFSFSTFSEGQGSPPPRLSANSAKKILQKSVATLFAHIGYDSKLIQFMRFLSSHNSNCEGCCLRNLDKMCGRVNEIHGEIPFTAIYKVGFIVDQYVRKLEMCSNFDGNLPC